MDPCRSRPPYQYQEYKYGHPYLTYLPQIFLSKLFFQKKFGWEVPYLPTVWTYEYKRHRPAPPAFFSKKLT